MKNTKKILSIFLALLMIISIIPMSSITASAATSGTCGENLTWTFDESTGTLTISGTGEMYNYVYFSSFVNQIQTPWFSFRSNIISVVIENGVTSIGQEAFFSCDRLTSISIPHSVTTIGNYAFYNCNTLVNLTIPNGVTSIGKNAFGMCTKLASVVIPNSVALIGDGAFYLCENLVNINVDSNNPNYSSDEYGVLFNKYKTSLIQYPSGNRRTNYIIPDNVKTICDNAFYCSHYLTSIKIPENVETIGEEAFFYCEGLISISVDNNNQYYSNDEYGVLFNKDKTILIQYPIGNVRASYRIPDSVTTIGNYAFYYSENLTSIVIGNRVTTIDNSFYLCGKLTSITIPVSVVSISNGAFYYCWNLTDVYYHGTQEQWRAIKIDGNNDPLHKATLHFNTVGEHMHVYTEEVVYPTCTEGGYTKYICECGDTYTSDWTDAPGHDFSVFVSSTAGHCQEGGIVIYACSVCGENVAMQVESGAHKLVSVDAKNPTCTEDGYLAYECCELCEYTTQIIVNKLGHEYTSEITTPATHTSKGIRTYTCIRCSDSYTEVIPADGDHQYTPEVTPPTCINSGYTTYTCYCGDSYVGNHTAPSGHKITTIVLTVATCKQQGMQYDMCEECGETLSDIVFTPSKEHILGKWEISVEATENTAGEKVQKCTVCGDIINKETIPPIVNEDGNYKVVDEETGVELEYQKDDYNGDVDIIVEETIDESVLNLVDTKTNASNVKLFNITMTVDGVATQPNGTVTIRIPLPAGFNPESSYIIYIDTVTGKIEKFDTTYENGYLVFETTHFSYYAVVEEVVNGYNYTFSIQTPSRTEIRNKDGIILHANIDGTAPNGSYVKWESNNSNFDKSADGSNFKIIAKNKGYTTFTAILCDADGNELARDSVEMYSKSGFFDKIGGFFRSLFGTTKIYDN